MKKLFVASFLLLMAFTFTMQAQHRGDFERPNREEMLQKMKEKLDLTDAQVKEIQKIDEKYHAQEEAFRTKMEKLRKEHKAMRDQKKAEVDKILTPEQRKKIETWKAKRGERRKDGLRRPMRRAVE